MSLGIGSYAQASYEFQAESSGDLSLQVGDVVKITDNIDGNWLTGQNIGLSQNASGNFPAAFVEPLSLPVVRTGQKIFLAVQDFPAEQSGDLELTKGDVIVGTEAVDEAWWRGKNGPLKGIFPVGFVVELWHDDGLRSRSYSARAGSLKSRSGSLVGSRTNSIGGYDGTKSAAGNTLDAGVTKVSEPTFATALVDVSPQLDGELAFQLGDLVEITEIIDDDWFFGRCHNKEGLVSAVCVELLEDITIGGDNEKSQHANVIGDYSHHESFTQPSMDHSAAVSNKDDDEDFPRHKTIESFESERGRTASGASYTSENTRSHDEHENIMLVPYAQVLFPFQGRPGWQELDLEEGQIVKLLQHLDQGWTEGELDGRRGIFPTSFVEIVVDCPSTTKLSSCNVPSEKSYASHSTSADSQTSSTSKLRSVSTDSNKTSHTASTYHDNMKDSSQSTPVVALNSSSRDNHDSLVSLHDKPMKDNDASQGLHAGIMEVIEIAKDSEIGLILHTFYAQMEGDVTVREGETVEVIRRVDQNWLEVQTDASEKGLVPRNHVEIIGSWVQEDKGSRSSSVSSDGLNASSLNNKFSSSAATSSVLTKNSENQVSGSYECSSYLSSRALPNSTASISRDQNKTHSSQELVSSIASSIQSGSVFESDSLSKKRKSSGKSPPPRPAALPNRKPGIPPKPAIAPKPYVKPKPPTLFKPAESLSGSESSRNSAQITSSANKTATVSKSPMSRSQSEGSQSQSTRPQALITAKPFSSLQRVKPQHVASPTERRLSLSSLDSIIENEMERERAKSRSSSNEGKDENGDSSSANISDTSTAPPADISLVSNSIGTSSSTNIVTDKKSQRVVQFYHQSPSISGHSYYHSTSSQLNVTGGKESLESLSKERSWASKDQSSHEDTSNISTTEPVESQDSTSIVISPQKSLLSDESQSSNSKRTLFSTKSLSVGSRQSSTKGSSNVVSSSQRHSTSIIDGSSKSLSVDNTQQVSRLPSQTSFVNNAFEMEVDEGNLVDVGGTSNQKLSKQTKVNQQTSGPLLVDIPKSRTAPTRPTGPRIAPAPSKMPLVPARVVPAPPTSSKHSSTSTSSNSKQPPAKIVPKRPAPKAPTSLAMVGSNNNRPTSIVGSSNKVTLKSPSKHASNGVHGADPQLTTQPARPAPVIPPQRVPPPRPADLMTFSPENESAPPLNTGVSEEATKEMLKDLKVKLEENKADIKKYEDSKIDLQEKLLQAQAENDSAKVADVQEQLSFVDSTLAGLQEEGRGLKENLFSLDPHEARLEKARLLAAQHAAEEEKRKEEDKKAEEERKRKRKEFRTSVLFEILDTEKDYLFSLQLCLETFVEGPKPPAGFDLEFLMGNMEEIADVSQKMVTQLETFILGRSEDDQCVGRCFSDHAEDMKNTYAPYCRNHDDVNTALEKLSDPNLTPPAVTDYINSRLDKMREQANVFDFAGVLIKPVQRILKYPLLLNELLKNTEDDHADKEDIVEAIKAMTDVAKAINEYKRRKDLVYKYKKSTDQSFGDKLSKLNLHSIKKKSSRMKGRLSTNLGIGLHTRDEAFEQEEAKFRNLEKTVRSFHRCIVQYLNDSQEQMNGREVFVDDIVEFYAERQCVEVQKLQEVTGKLMEHYNSMRETIETVVVIPLNTLVSLFSAPSHVIEKRFDKLLDYNNQLGKTDNDKELLAAKNDYEAMNAQLLDELPKFYDLAYGMLRNCVSAYVLARRDFMDQSLKESCSLLELPSIASKSNLMETFNIRHTTAFDHVSLLSFIPRGFNPRVDTIKADKARLKGKVSSGVELVQAPAAVQASPGSQSESQRSYLRSTYPATKLFTVTTPHTASDLMDISLSEGTLVGVVKELDPMGNKERWFIDDGLSKGFAPSTGLTPAAMSPTNSSNNFDEEEEILSIQSYDDGDNIVISGNDGRSTLESSYQKQEPQQPQYHYALYDFAARQPNEATLQAGHPVSVLAFQDIDGNSEWWLVEDMNGQRGYAPANYMAPMPYS